MKPKNFLTQAWSGAYQIWKRVKLEFSETLYHLASLVTSHAIQKSSIDFLLYPLFFNESQLLPATFKFCIRRPGEAVGVVVRRQQHFISQHRAVSLD